MNERQRKIAEMQRILKSDDLGAFRLRGVDWFSWATGGGSSVVLQTDESGVAEIFVTRDSAFILTDSIEAERLKAEECNDSYTVWECAWQNRDSREDFVRSLTEGRAIASDRPSGDERRLPRELIEAKLCLMPEEIQRYRALGREASQAMSEVLRQARPDWTGFQLAAEGAAALWKRGIHPALVLIGDARRLPIYRHPTPSADRLGDRAMMVFCARRGGLFANLTRFVYFRKPTAEDLALRDAVAAVEARAWAHSRPGKSLGEVYEQIVQAYGEYGFPDEYLKHHQGGTTGYRAREEVAGPESRNRLKTNMALAWNPSLTGTKIEDTVIVAENGVEVLTEDAEWPHFIVNSQRRPDYLVRP